MSSIVILLSPIWISWKNEFLRGGQRWRRRWLLVALATAFWCGIYYVVRRVLLYFQSVYDLGPSLAYQLLLIILLTFLSMLLFSNLITALSNFFLARDLDLLRSTPVSTGSFYYSRLITTILNSSWMVLFFSLPIFAAYGTVFGSGSLFYLWVAVVLPLFLIIPASVGVLITHLLVYCLPAKRIRDILFFIGLFSFFSSSTFSSASPSQSDWFNPKASATFCSFLPPWKRRRRRFCQQLVSRSSRRPSIQKAHGSRLLLRPPGKLRAVFAPGHLLGLRRRLLDRLVQGPGIQAGTHARSRSSKAL